jgi:2,4-dienoyl-CoA reductase-like NADH-dependent reductase (Old Yellow Enzyme family)
MGFLTIEAKIPWSNGFMAPIAARVRAETGLPLATAWGMDKPEDATAAIDKAQMDVVMVARGHLADPHYPFRLARNLGIPKSSALLPDQYAYWLARYPGPQNGEPVD